MLEDGWAEVRGELQMSLEPHCLFNIREAVEQHLNRMLLQYDEAMGGIVMGYWNIKTKTENAAILASADQAMLFEFQATFLVFRFGVDSWLIGQVKSVGGEHINILLLNAVNVSIISKDLKDRFKFKEEQCAWESRELNDEGVSDLISVGKHVCFRVKNLLFSDSYFSLDGAIENIKGSGLTQRRYATPEDPELLKALYRKWKMSSEVTVEDSATPEKSEVENFSQKRRLSTSSITNSSNMKRMKTKS